MLNTLVCSRTKMSQFMNSARRLKGWRDVEAKLDKWLIEFKLSNRTAYIRFLNSQFQPKIHTHYADAEILQQANGRHSTNEFPPLELLFVNRSCTNDGGCSSEVSYDN